MFYPRQPEKLQLGTGCFGKLVTRACVRTRSAQGIVSPVLFEHYIVFKVPNNSPNMAFLKPLGRQCQQRGVLSITIERCCALDDHASPADSSRNIRSYFRLSSPRSTEVEAKQRATLDCHHASWRAVYLQH